jgi:hypothetical protein
VIKLADGIWVDPDMVISLKLTSEPGMAPGSTDIWIKITFKYGEPLTVFSGFYFVALKDSEEALTGARKLVDTWAEKING